jgi:2-polyprenyl-3-methyl-5-hydroxy-6-metoxy-1,4-benzoquinol methylase
MGDEALLSWVESPCNGCGSAESGQLLFEGTDLMMGLPGRFRLVQCPQCGLIRQNPRLSWESLKEYYPGDYNPYKQVIKTEHSMLRRLDRRYGMWKRLRSIERFQPGGRLLDVGCGTGVFLGEAQLYGRWELFGVEPSPQAAEYAKKTLGIPIVAQRFIDVGLPDRSFDVLTMWNVLEHLDEPVEDLRHAFQMLSPGGLLVLAIPNVDGLGVKLFGPYWMGWDLPRHLYMFPKKQLRKTMEEIGFTWLDTRCIAGGHSSLALSFEFLFTAKQIRKGVLPFLLKLYRSLPARIAFSPLFFLADQFRQCSLITVFAQKRSTGISHD